MKTDVIVEKCGNIFLFQLMSQNAEEWVYHKTDEDRIMFGNALVIDQHYAAEITNQMYLDGLELI